MIEELYLIWIKLIHMILNKQTNNGLSKKEVNFSLTEKNLRCL